MLAYTYLERGKFALLDKPKPVLLDPGDAVVRVTLASICTSDLHIKHGSVPRAVPGVTVGHEMVGVVEETGSDVRTRPPRRPGGRQCGDLLRLLLFLPTRLGQQLHRSQRRLGPGLPHRRRAGGVCPGPLRRPGADQDPSRRDGPAGPVRGGHPGHRLLGRSDLRDLTGGHGARPGRRPHRPVHSPVRPAGKPQAGHRL